MTTPDDEPRRDAPRFIVPVPVGSVDAAAVRAGGGFVVVASVVVLLLQVAVTVLVARGSDVARLALAGIAVVALGLAVVAGGAGLGAVVLVVAVAALFVPSSSAWFRELHRGGGAR